MSLVGLNHVLFHLVSISLLDGQVMVIGRSFDRPVTEWALKGHPGRPKNYKKDADLCGFSFAALFWIPLFGKALSHCRDPA